MYFRKWTVFRNGKYKEKSVPDDNSQKYSKYSPKLLKYQEPGISWLQSEMAVNRKQNQDAFPDKHFKATTIKMLQWAITKTLKVN